MQQSHQLLEQSTEDDSVFVYDTQDNTIPRLIPNNSYYGYCQDEHHDYEYAIEEPWEPSHSTNCSTNPKQFPTSKKIDDLPQEMGPYIYQQPQFFGINEPCSLKTTFRISHSASSYQMTTENERIECHKTDNYAWNINNNFRKVEKQRRSRVHTQWKLIKQNEVQAIINSQGVFNQLIIYLGGSNNIFSQQLVLDIDNIGGDIEVRLKEDIVCHIDECGVGWTQYPLSLVQCLFIYTSC